MIYKEGPAKINLAMMMIMNNEYTFHAVGSLYKCLTCSFVQNPPEFLPRVSQDVTDYSIYSSEYDGPYHHPC